MYSRLDPREEIVLSVRLSSDLLEVYFKFKCKFSNIVKLDSDSAISYAPSSGVSVLFKSKYKVCKFSYLVNDFANSYDPSLPTYIPDKDKWRNFKLLGENNDFANATDPFFAISLFPL